MEIDTKIGRLNEEWEENYNSYSNYLIDIIDSFIGKRITNRFGTDWGGVNVWGNGGCYEGDFICLDEDYNLTYFSRISNGEVGVIDTDILSFNCEGDTEKLVIFLTTINIHGSKWWETSKYKS